MCFNISMSISHDETTGEFNVCLTLQHGTFVAQSMRENNVWANGKCCKGGFSHFSETTCVFMRSCTGTIQLYRLELRRTILGI